MYEVIIPVKTELAILRELHFWSQKDPIFAERVAIEVEFHLMQTLKKSPRFGASASKKAGFLYYPIADRFKLVFEIKETDKQVIVHQFFHDRRKISRIY